jgi:hypothetical protein
MTDDRFPIDFSVEVAGTTYRFHPWAGGYEWWNTRHASYKKGSATFELVDEIARLRSALAGFIDAMNTSGAAFPCEDEPCVICDAMETANAALEKRDDREKAEG